MSVFVRCLDAAPTKSCGIGPKRCHGTTRSPGNSTMRCIAAVWLVSFMTFHFFSGVGPFSLYLFFYFYRGIQGVRFSTNRAVAYPSMSLPSTCQTQLGRAVLGSKLFMLIFLFVRFLGICRKPTRLPYISMGRPSHPRRGVQSLRENDGRTSIR